jgi:hypothetical protein
VFFKGKVWWPDYLNKRGRGLIFSVNPEIGRIIKREDGVACMCTRKAGVA